MQTVKHLGKQRFFGPNCFPVSTVDQKNLTSKGDILEIMQTLFQRARIQAVLALKKSLIQSILL